MYRTSATMALFLRPPLESAIVTLRHGSGQARPDCLARCPYRMRRKMRIAGCRGGVLLAQEGTDQRQA
jgi:hypothetical protein